MPHEDLVRAENVPVRASSRRAGDPLAVGRLYQVAQHDTSLGLLRGHSSSLATSVRLRLRASSARAASLGNLYLRLLPDGTVIWTAPSGQVYTTTPGGTLFFPALATSTGQLLIPESSGPAPSNRGLMMPTRQRTRAQDRAYRITLQRQHNAARITRKQLLFAERIARNDQPPPF